MANQFLQGEEDVDNPVVRDIIKRLDSYKEAFAHVARQLLGARTTRPVCP